MFRLAKKSIELHNFFPLPARPLLPLVVLPPKPGGYGLLNEPQEEERAHLLSYICASWLERFDVVVLVYLRDEAIQNAYTLADFLPARTLELSQCIATELQATDGKNVRYL